MELACSQGALSPHCFKRRFEDRRDGDRSVGTVHWREHPHRQTPNPDCIRPNATGPKSTHTRPVIRDVLLRGKTTGVPYIFAHTHLFPERLATPVQTQLSETNVPIGKVFREHRLEDFRQIEERGVRTIPAVAGVLGGEASDQMRWRRYSVLSGGLVIMEITEVFSERLFETTPW